SSAGLRVFLAVAKKLKAVNGRFVFVGMQEHVREVFDLTGLLHVFTLCDREEDAIKSLNE
ncbi:MAG TPA: STAS domain-containing protein, partial [Candidatus Wallbacteria bacterium]|nr:STAS domain-containing protein [Candidatus Wallbacteria bacterium]